MTTAKQQRYLLPPTFESGSDRNAAVSYDTPAKEVHFSGMEVQYRTIIGKQATTALSLLQYR